LLQPNSLAHAFANNTLIPSIEETVPGHQSLAICSYLGAEVERLDLLVEETQRFLRRYTALGSTEHKLRNRHLLPLRKNNVMHLCSYP
jgi:hypothetical protein